MDNKHFLTSTAETFTLSLLFVSLFNLALSREATELRQVSALFALCGEGISFIALGELLVLSAVIAALRMLWFSQRFFRNMLMLHRVTLMLVSVFCAAGLCSVVFGWFPPSMWQAWVGFAASFGIGTAAGFTVMLIRMRTKSRRYQRNLTAYNDRHGKGEDEDGGTAHDSAS